MMTVLAFGFAITNRGCMQLLHVVTRWSAEVVDTCCESKALTGNQGS